MRFFLRVPAAITPWLCHGRHADHACMCRNLALPIVQVNCRLAVSRSLGDSQFKGNGGQPRGSKEAAKGEGQLVSPEPAVSNVKLVPRDRVIIVASGK